MSPAPVLSLRTPVKCGREAAVSVIEAQSDASAGIVSAWIHNEVTRTAILVMSAAPVWLRQHLALAPCVFAHCFAVGRTRLRRSGDGHCRPLLLAICLRQIRTIDEGELPLDWCRCD